MTDQIIIMGIVAGALVIVMAIAARTSRRESIADEEISAMSEDEIEEAVEHRYLSNQYFYDRWSQ